ncbi:DNA-cytosine methyltransferase [Streptococcus phage Javan426]|uniref:Prophage LambdaSa04, methyltransferase, C-5 cytosine-specific family protein n=1 Tax=Streptococcus porcinus str. Jelinkova 176 TaxID=873448 RepID=A0ABN0CY27_STRPO|nr:prophage LambdaSa04, methyltransferase, C-5 cytosine-specific family protein [Streptococcus porcinus str. Jelinkova 176]QBX27989.1 DNA-cytosine methyltransferase [Streptococcus phage Javan426]
MTTSQALTPHNFPKKIYGLRKALVKMCLSQENEPAYTVSEVDSFLHLLTSSKAKRKKINPNGFSLKMLRDFYQVAGDEIISTISLSWMKQGTTLNGKCSTQKTTEFPKTESASTLSDIYFRSRGRRQVLPLSREGGNHLKQIIGGMQSYRVYDPSGIVTTLVGEGGGLGAKTGLYLID